MTIAAPQKDAYHLILEAIDTGDYKPGDRTVESDWQSGSECRARRSARRCNGWKPRACLRVTGAA